jgi:hypothetical protein
MLKRFSAMKVFFFVVVCELFKFDCKMLMSYNTFIFINRLGGLIW